MDNQLNSLEKWLNSLELGKYHQSFLDNGYDDLEICKQLGEPDLDAIGVDSTSDRQKLLEAVKQLNDYTTKIEYHTLEEESDDLPEPPPLENENERARSETPGPGADQAVPEVANIAKDQIIVKFTKNQLMLLLKEKLLEDYIDLSNPPYTLQNLAPCWSSLTALAVKYSTDLKTYLDDILDTLEDLRWQKITEDTASVYTPASMTSSMLDAPGYHHGYHSPQEGPPPIPSIPPPDVSHLDLHGQLQSVQTRYSYEVTGPAGTYHAGDGDAKKKTSTLGRLFRNIGFRKSSRKHSYKKQQGDLLAHEITMGDNDRIALMQMVKEGKITTETALQVVKRFEEERKKEKHSQDTLRSKKGQKSKSKKTASPKPAKSPSVYSDEENECDSCSNVLLCNPGSISSPQWREYETRCCPHGWSHSQGSDPQWSPDSTQALLYSPMRSRATHPPAMNSPVTCPKPSHQHQKIYTPVIPHELKMASSSRAPYGAHGIGILRDRLNLMKTSSCVHKTQSKASLISSESDLSLESSSHTAVSQTETPQIDESYFCAFNTAASAGSDTGSDLVSHYAKSRYLMTGPGQFVHSPDCRVMTQSQSPEVRGHLLGQSQLLGQGQGYTLTQIVSFGRASCNYTPSEEEKDFLQLKRGDYIQILDSPSPIYKLGRVNNRIGYFHDSMVEAVPDPSPVGYLPGGPGVLTPHRRDRQATRGMVRRSQPKTVDDLLQRLGLEHLCSIFSSNGYDSLEIFAEIDHEDLNALGILDSESRTKLLTAAKLLMDYEDITERPPSRVNRSTTATPSSQTYQAPWTSYFPQKPSTGSRDSGCYDSSEYMTKEMAEAYSSINSGNKDGHRAVAGHTGNKIMLSKNYCDRTFNGANAGNLLLGENVQYRQISQIPGKPEKIYSEEDREVRNITGYQSDHSLQNGQNKVEDGNVAQKRNMKLNIPVLTDWKYFMDNCTQTVQQYASLSESYHTDPNSIQALDSNTQEQILGFFKLKSKPYIKKNSPNVEGKDVQVQCMFPLGVGFTPSPQLIDQTAPQTSVSASSEQTASQDIVSFYLPSDPTSPQGVTTSSQLAKQAYTRQLSTGYQIPKQTGSKVITSESQNSEQTGTQETDPRLQLTLNDSNCLILLKKSPGDELLASGQTNPNNTARNDSSQDGGNIKADNSSGTDGEVGRSTPVHMGFKSIKRSLIPRVTSKLAAESIDLAQEPYSTKSGACGIPPLLIQRYAEELKQDLQRVSLVLDQVRAHKLATVNRPVILADNLSQSIGEGSELKVSSIADFFTSIGLPMYIESCGNHGYATVESLANLSIKEIHAITGAERKHLKRIIHALEWVQNKLASQSTRKIKTSPVKDKV